MTNPPTEATASVRASDLPPGFVLGTATSSYQIEGAASADGKGRSIWDVLCEQPGAIADGSSGRVACDHLARMDEDLDLIAELGVDVYRFSVSWPRVQPTGRGTVLAAGLDHYDRLVDGLLERGIQPYLTLYHWDLPWTLEDELGGWRHRDTAGRFADYAAVVADRLGDRVARWGTLNEPFCSAWLGYEAGQHAPGVEDEAGAVRAAHHLMLGHGMAVQALRAAGVDDIGIVINPSEVRPATDRDADVDAAHLVDAIHNRWWFGALAGDFPAEALEVMRALVDLDELSRDGDAATTAEPIDWLGINTYFPTIARAGDDPGLRPPGPGLDGIEAVPPDPGEAHTMLDWRVDPTIIPAVLRQAHGYLPDLPIVITENGMAHPDELASDGTCHDPWRVAYLTDHLAATLHARRDGIPVEGYLAWSLLDNFEWAYGYGPRFGLAHVDFDTQRRTPKSSFRWLQELASSR